MNRREQVAHGLALAMLAGPWTPQGLLARTRTALDRTGTPKWLRELTAQVLDAYRDPPRDRPRELAGFLQTCPAWDKAWEHRRPPLHVVDWTPPGTAMAAHHWPVAALADVGELARLLDVDQGELAWFADVRGLERRSPAALQHYRWTALQRPSGIRLVAAPKPRLKEIQRRLLRHVLGPIPTHDAAHGCIPGRSVRTALAPHARASVVIRADLASFYPSIPAGRVWGLLCTAGLPEAVAHVITGLVTTVVPHAVLRTHHVDATTAARLRTPHLPIGAPTSPALANLIAFTLDRRLDGLAASFDARYTRYVDDLTFSGGSALRAGRSRFVALVDEIVRAEGFRLNDRKTVVLGQSGRQAALGAVLNDRPTLPRPERDALRALLHNCRVHGWRSQARGRDQFPAYVLGRISWAAGLDPEFGARMRTAHAAIDWS